MSNTPSSSNNTIHLSKYINKSDLKGLEHLIQYYIKIHYIRRTLKSLCVDRFQYELMTLLHL